MSKIHKTKQISYLTLIFLVIASAVGAGIFYKNNEINELAYGNLWLVIGIWTVAAFGILALGLVLIKIMTAQKKACGLLDWTKNFTSKWFHKSTLNYIKYIYNPLNMFVLPIYVVMSLQDSGWELPDGWGILVVAFCVFLFFNILNLFSIKTSKKFQWFLTAIKFLPLIILPIIASINSDHLINVNNEFNPNFSTAQKDLVFSNGLNGVSPWMIVIAGIPAISFAYNGFYRITFLEKQNFPVKKTSLVFVISLIVIAVIYLFIAIGFNLGSANGSIYNFKPAFIPAHVWDGLYKALNIFLALAIMAIVNSFSSNSPKQISLLMRTGEANNLVWIQKIFFKKQCEYNCEKQQYFASWLFYVVLVIVMYLIFGLIGYFWYNPNPVAYIRVYGIKSANIYALNDILINFISIIIFVILATIALAWSYQQWKKGNVFYKQKLLILSVIITSIIIYASFGYLFVQAIVGITGFNHANPQVFGIQFFIFISLILISCASPTFWMIRTKITKKPWIDLLPDYHCDHHLSVHKHLIETTLKQQKPAKKNDGSDPLVLVL